MYAYVAILGDSPVVIVDEKGSVHVGPEHNARSNPTDREAAIKSGALYTLTGYITMPGSDRGLQLTRCLGDSYFNDILDRTPEVYIEKLNEKSIVLLGTDGLFDPGHVDSQRVAQVLISLVREGADAEELVKWRTQQLAQDNVTAIVVCGTLPKQ